MDTILVTAEDVLIAEQACRCLAERYRETAKRQMLAVLRDGFERHARHFELVAERMRQARLTDDFPVLEYWSDED